MTFIQIVEFTTPDYHAIEALADEWQRSTEGTRTTRRDIVTRDRNDPNHYLSIVFFDSYESAMENSRLAATQAFADKLSTVVTEPPVFHDLDLIDDRT